MCNLAKATIAALIIAIAGMAYEAVRAFVVAILFCMTSA